MPVWHEAARKWVKEGRLVLLGVTQEQHADRCRLFAQWKGFDWPILHDPINRLESAAVPILTAIDERGIVRSVGPKPETFEREFLDREFPAPPAAPAPAAAPARAARAPDLSALRRQAETAASAAAWREYGDALVLWGRPERVSDAVAAYRKALESNPEDTSSRFRLGVVHRMRYEGPGRQEGDFQAAVRHWEQALAANPNQYIWRRRIQQYGPRLEKPYPFYDWVEQARAEIKARGEQPVELAVPPSGAEIAGPARDFAREGLETRSPDPEGKITRDRDGLVRVETAVVPARLRAGQTARVHVSFHPDDRQQAHWNNEAEPLRLWVDVPGGWQASRPLLAAPQGDRPETNEARRLDFEVKAPAGARGMARLDLYALYYICEGIGGSCRFLRQDIPVTIEVAP